MGIRLSNEVTEARKKSSEQMNLLYQEFCADTHKFSNGRLSDKEVKKIFYKVLIPVIHEAVANKLKGSPHSSEVKFSAVKLCHLSLKGYITLVSLYGGLFKFRVLSAEFDEGCIFCEIIFNASSLEDTSSLAFSDFLDTLKDYVNSLYEISFELLKTLNRVYDYTEDLDPWVRENIIPDYMFYLLCDRNYFRHKLSADKYNFDSLVTLLSGFDDIMVLQVPGDYVMVKIGIEPK